MNEQKTVHAIIAELAHKLVPIYHTIPASQRCAWQILMCATGLTREQLFMQRAITLTDEQNYFLNIAVHDMVEQHKPLAYVIGSVEFLGLPIQVRPPVLIPRPETEDWVGELCESCGQYDNKPLRILDLCTGSGCIALALAHRLPMSHVWAGDIAHEAIVLAQENKQRLGIDNVTFVASDLFEKFADQIFDLIVTNPPYIGERESALLDPSVTNWEDQRALFSGNDGSDLIQKIITQSDAFLDPHSAVGQLWMEVGHTQAPAVAALMRVAGFTGVRTVRDIANIERVVVGEKITWEK